MPFAGGGFKHIFVEGFLILPSGEIKRMEPFHAFDTQQLKKELSSRLTDTRGAVLKFTMEEVEPAECISYEMKQKIKIEILGNVPEEIIDNLRKELEDGSI